MIMEIDKTLIPYSFEIDLNGGIYNIEVHYNSMYDFFTLDLLKENEVLYYGEKVVYGRKLFSTTKKNIPTIKALDLSGNENRVTWDNLGNTVFLYVGDEYA